MRKFFTLFGLVISSLILFQSCLVSYGDTNERSFTPINYNYTKSNSDSMYIFFSGEEIDFNYEKIGLVEAKGHEYASNSEILDNLKYVAWTKGANGIIFVRNNYAQRESGYLFDSENEEAYDAKVYEGMAVHIETDSCFLNKYAYYADTQYISAVQQQIEDDDARASQQIGCSIVAGFAAVVLFIIAIDAQEEEEY
jgi:hypothetical protein